MSRVEPIQFREVAPVNDFHYPRYDTTPREQELHFEPDRPALDPPGTASKPFFASLANFMETLSAVEHIYMDGVEGRMQDVRSRYVQNFEKGQQLNRELDEQLKARDWWGNLQTVAMCLLAAVSLMSGGVIFGTAATLWEFGAGGAMIASGVATIAGVTMNQLNTNRELAAIFTTVGAAMGLVGGVATGYFAIANAQEFAGKVVLAAIGITSSLSDVTKESYSMKISELKGANTLIQRVFEEQSDKFQALMSDAEFFMERVSDNISLCANIQRKHEQSIRRIVYAQEYAG